MNPHDKKHKKDKKEKKTVLPDEYPGQDRAVPIAAPPKGMWYDPKVKEGKSSPKNKPHSPSLNDAVRYFIDNPDLLGIPGQFDMDKKLVHFSTGKKLSFDEVVQEYMEASGKYKEGGDPSDQWGHDGFFDSKRDIGKDPSGDFPSVQWMPRGTEDMSVNEDITTANKKIANQKAVDKIGNVINFIRESATLGKTLDLYKVKKDIQSFNSSLPKNSKMFTKMVLNMISESEKTGDMFNYSRVLELLTQAQDLVRDRFDYVNASLRLSALDKIASQLDFNRLAIAVEEYVKTLDLEFWHDHYFERYIDNFRDEYAENRGRGPHPNVIENLSEEIADNDPEWWYEQYSDDAVQYFLEDLEAFKTEEELAEDYPEIHNLYTKVNTDPSIDVESSDDYLTLEHKEQITAKYGPEYVSALNHYFDALANGHPEDRAIEYAVREMEKVDITVLPDTIAELSEIYIAGT